MAELRLKVEGNFPVGIQPDTIRVEPEKGTFGLYQGDTRLADGQFVTISIKDEK